MLDIPTRDLERQIISLAEWAADDNGQEDAPHPTDGAMPMAAATIIAGRSIADAIREGLAGLAASGEDVERGLCSIAAAIDNKD